VISPPPPHYAVVDFDNTAIIHDSAEALLNQMALHGDLSVEDFRHYYELLRSGDMESAYRFGAATLRGFSPEEVNALALRAMAKIARENLETDWYLPFN
jgi:hypothetical protein